jgi:hypothetical protein
MRKTIARAKRFPWAKPRAGTPNTFSRAPKREEKMRREVHARRSRAGHSRRVARSIARWSASCEGRSRCAITPWSTKSVPE